MKETIELWEQYFMNTDYEDLLRNVLENGVSKGDRTGTGTISSFGHQMRFDLSEGFPLITTKKVHTRSIIGELLWFLNGDTKNSNLSDQKIRIWNEWQNSDGTIGPGYSAQWRAWYAPSDKIISVPLRKDNYADFIYELPVDDNDRNDEKFVRSVYGVGFLGEEVADTPERVKELWLDIMSHSYNNSDDRYHRETTREVSPIWHSFEMFAKTINTVPGYHEWSMYGGYTLDVEYFGSSVYSPNTSVFLKDGSNPIIEDDILLIDKEKFSNVEEYKKKHGKDPILSNVDFVKPEAGTVWRKQVFVDQISEVIETLKTNPDSRRMIVSAWNAAELDNMALMPCHAFFQFYVADGKLSCQLYQRSADLFLGVPFNIASYALLTHMVAQQVGLEVGDFVWTGGDCHIYNNLVEQVKEQISREPYPFPKLNLNKAEDIFSYTIDDVKIEDYQHHPIIRGKVSV